MRDPATVLSISATVFIGGVGVLFTPGRWLGVLLILGSGPFVFTSLAAWRRDRGVPPTLSVMFDVSTRGVFPNSLPRVPLRIKNDGAVEVFNVKFEPMHVDPFVVHFDDVARVPAGATVEVSHRTVDTDGSTASQGLPTIIEYATMNALGQEAKRRVFNYGLHCRFQDAQQRQYELTTVVENDMSKWVRARFRGVRELPGRERV